VAVDEPSDSPVTTNKPGTFVPGDPRIRRSGGRPAGIPNKKNRPALAILQAAQEQLAKGLVSMAQAEVEGEPCIMCGRGRLRNEDTRIKASAEVLDRSGMPKATQVEVSEAPDESWMDYATDEELAQFIAIAEAARARMVE
jgi:hypothetical protein